MTSSVVEIIETELPVEETMSANHSRLTYRLSLALAAYEEQYDIMPELEFDLAAGRLKPNVALMTKQAYDWEKDIILYTEPPITAIEIISPTQSLDSLVTKIRDGYLPSGVRSAWLVLPAIRTINLYLPNQPVIVVASGILHDPISGIEVDVAKLFC